MLDFLKIKNKFFLFLLIFMGCATTYHPKNIFGGYESRQIGPNTYEVKFRGNQHTHSEIIREFLLYRCAELTLENNFSNFIILSDDSYTKESIYESDISQPFTHRESLSGGHITIVEPEFDVHTKSNDFTGIFLITLFNETDPSFQSLKRSGYTAEKIINDLKSKIK